MKNLFAVFLVFSILSGCTGQKVRTSNRLMEEQALEDKQFLNVTDQEIEKYSDPNTAKNIFYKKCVEKEEWKNFESLTACIQDKRSRELTRSEDHYLERKAENENNKKRFPKGSIDAAIEKKRVKTR